MSRIKRIAVLPLLLISLPAVPGSFNLAIVTPVPVMTQPGLLILAVALGIAGAKLLNRRRK